jgi:flagellar motor switch protein FliN/FliY
MADFTTDDLFAFNNVLGSLADVVALAMSESLNQMVTCDPPTIRTSGVEELMGQSGNCLKTSFSLQPLSPDIIQITFPEHDAGIFASILTGGETNTPISPLLDEHMAALANAMNGVGQGIANAIGNVLNETLTLKDCATTAGQMTLPPSFATEETAVIVELPYSIEGVIDGTTHLYFTPSLAQLIAPAQSANDMPSPADAFDMNEAFGGGGLSNPSPAFEPFSPQPSAMEGMPRGIEMVMDIPLEVTVELGQVKMPIRDVLSLSSGSIVELDRVAGEPVDLLVNGKLLARGEVVVIDDNFGIRITEIVSPADRIANLGVRR